jgi:hypothetical protein
MSDSPTLRENIRRYRFGPRDVRQFVYFVVAFILVALIGLYAFALVFNEVTIFFWLFAAGAFVFRHGFTQYRNRLAVSGTATAKTSSAAIGLAELTGRGFAERVSNAPITKTPCLFWKLEVEQWSTQSKRRGWVSKVSRSFGVEALEIEDDFGRLLVWTRGAELIHIKQVWRSEDGNPPDAVLRLVTAAGLEWPPPSSRHPIRVMEERIPSEQPLYLMGTVAERRQIPERPPSRLPRLLKRWADTAPRLDDQSFLAAFRFASQHGRRWLGREFRPAVPDWTPPSIDAHQVLVWKGDQRRPFIIAGLTERDALRALSRKALAYIFGGAAVMAVTIFVAISKLTDTMR